MPSKGTRNRLPRHGWMLATADGQEVATIQPVAKEPAGRIAVELPQPTLGLVSNLLKSVSLAGAGGSLVGGQVFLCTFAPAVLEGLRNGTHVFGGHPNGLQASVKTLDGKYAGNAFLLPPAAVKAVVVVAVVWQVMAVITAQVYLSNIDSRLRSIEQDVADIKFHLESSVRAKLASDMQILKACHATLCGSAASIDERRAMLSQVRDVDQDSSATFLLAMEKLQGERTLVGQWDPAANTFFSSSMYRRTVEGKRYAARANDAIRISVAALELKAACLTLATHLPADIAWVDERTRDLESSIDMLRIRVRELEVAYEAKLPTLKALFRGTMKRLRGKRYVKPSENSALPLAPQSANSARFARKLASTSI